MMIDNPWPGLSYTLFWTFASYLFLTRAAFKVRNLWLIPIACLALWSAGGGFLFVPEFSGNIQDYLVVQSLGWEAAKTLILLILAIEFLISPFKWNSKWVFLGLFATSFAPTLFSNLAMQNILAVCLLPIVARGRLRLPLIALAALQVGLSGERIGLGLFGIWAVLSYWPAALLVVAAIAWKWNPTVWLKHFSVRTEVWDLIFWDAWDNARWFGHGIGSAWTKIRYLQQSATNMQEGAFLQAHNDYLQCFFELGLVGCGAAVLAVWEVFRRSLKDAKLSLLLFGAGAFWHYPFHEPLTQLTLLFLVKKALN